MSDQGFQYPLQHLVLSHSTSSSYRSCARKLEFRKFYGEEKQELDEFGNPVDNYAADCGKALHEGYQDFLVHQNQERATLAFMMKFPVMAEAFQETSYRSMEACYATLLAMFNHEVSSRYELVQIKLKDGSIKPAVEVPYVIEFVDSPMAIPVYHVGLIDCILFDKVGQRYIVVDIKTHRDNTTDLSLRYEFDEQTVPYGIILEHILGHQIADFTVAYLSCYIDLLEPKIRLYDFIKTQDHVRDWLIGQCLDIKNIDFYMRNQWFPRAINGQTCMAFRKRCAHADICGYREPKVLGMMIKGEPRESLFHDGKEPWITVKIPYLKELVA